MEFKKYKILLISLMLVMPGFTYSMDGGNGINWRNMLQEIPGAIWEKTCQGAGFVRRHCYNGMSTAGRSTATWLNTHKYTLGSIASVTALGIVAGNSFASDLGCLADGIMSSDTNSNDKKILSESIKAFSKSVPYLTTLFAGIASATYATSTQDEDKNLADCIESSITSGLLAHGFLAKDLSTAIASGIIVNSGMRSVVDPEISSGQGFMSMLFAGLSAVATSTSVPNKNTSKVAVPAAALLASSWTNGVWRTRVARTFIGNMESKYTVDPDHAWHDCIDRGVKGALCIGVGAPDQAADDFYVGVEKVMNAAKSTGSQNALWEGLKAGFVNGILGTLDSAAAQQAQASTVISVNNFTPFGAPSVGDFKLMLINQKNSIDQDLKRLCNLSSLSFREIEQVKDLAGFLSLKDKINSLSNYCGTYMMMGTAGYSAYHNHYRVKQLLIKLIEYRRFIMQMQALMMKHSGADAYFIDDTVGYLYFTI